MGVLSYSRPRAVFAIFLAYLLALTTFLPAGLARANPLAASVVASSQELSAGDQLDVADSPLYFKVVDPIQHTVSVGGNPNAYEIANLPRGTGFKAVNAFPEDHAVTIPEKVTVDGVDWKVVSVADYAFLGSSSRMNSGKPAAPSAASQFLYVNDVTIEAKDIAIGQLAFAGYNSGAYKTENFKLTLKEGASIGSLCHSSFSYMQWANKSSYAFPEGASLSVSLSSDEAPTSGAGHYIASVSDLVYPKSYNGVVYQACTELKSMEVLSPYTKFAQTDGLKLNTKGTAYIQSYPASFSMVDSSSAPVVYVWAGSVAETSLDSVEAYKYLHKTAKDDAGAADQSKQIVKRHMAVLQNDYTLSGITKPDSVDSAYGAQASNVKVNNLTEGVISGTLEIPDNMLSVANGDETEWTLAEGTDYTVNYYTSESATDALVSAPVTAGDYWVEFVGNDKTAWGTTGRYKLTLSQSKTALAAGDVTLTVPESGYTYDGTAKEPAVAVLHNGTSLTAGADYTVAYSDNTNAGTATATVTGIGSYAGSVSKTFQIVKLDLSNGSVTIQGGGEYYGGEWKPSVIVNAGGKEVAKTEYTVTYADNINPGTGTATVTANDDSVNYTGSNSATFGISKANLVLATTEDNITGENTSGNVSITFDPVNGKVMGKSTYMGSAIEPDVSELGLIYIVNSTPNGNVKVPITSADYTTEGWTNNTNVGEASITLTGAGNYTNSTTLKWAIEAKSLADDDVTVTGLDNQAWTGSAVTPPEPVVKVGDRTLAKGTDYDVAYGENLTDVGSVDVTITGKGNYTGSPTGTFFRIGKLLTNAEVTIADADKQVYTGSPLTPAVTVRLADDTLNADQDYTVQYSDNTNAGTATVTITGAEDYAGTVTKTFEIAKAEVAAPSAVSGLTYNGEEQTGVVVASDAGYTATGAAATNAGSYTATLTADGNHTFADGKATAEVAWSIARAQVDKPTAKAGLKYTGKAQTGVTFATGAGYAMSGTTQATNAGSYTAKAALDANHAWTGGSTGDATVSWSIAKAASSISLAAQSKTYTGKALAYSGKVTKSGSTGAVTYAYYSDSACKKAVKAANVKAAGTYYVKATVAANANYAAATSAAAKFTVAKAANPLAVKAASKTLQVKAVKKKTQSFTPSVVKTKGQGTLSYVKYKVNKKSGNFTVNKKSGKITVKKGTPKGTYTVQVKVTAAGNANYKASAVKVAKVTVKVK